MREMCFQSGTRSMTAPNRELTVMCGSLEHRMKATVSSSHYGLRARLKLQIVTYIDVETDKYWYRVTMKVQREESGIAMRLPATNMCVQNFTTWKHSSLLPLIDEHETFACFSWPLFFYGRHGSAVHGANLPLWLKIAEKNFSQSTNSQSVLRCLWNRLHLSLCFARICDRGETGLQIFFAKIKQYRGLR